MDNETINKKWRFVKRKNANIDKGFHREVGMEKENRRLCKPEMGVAISPVLIKY